MKSRTSAAPSATLSTDGDNLLVLGAELTQDRHARLYFRSVLGAAPIAEGWRCPRRRLRMSALILRAYDWLDSRGYQVEAQGEAGHAVARELERRRSFARTRIAASRLISGEASYPFTRVNEALDTFRWSRPLRPHQRDAVAHALTAVNAANFSVPGSGKTAAALATAVSHLHAGTIDLILVVGPLACFDPWEQETRTLVGDRIPVRRIRGSARHRLQAYASAAAGRLLLLSYATAAADQSALLELFVRLRTMLIVDESHRIKRFRGGLWAPALAELARRARVRLVLSGTPMPQSGKDLYSQLTVLWPDGQLTGTRDAFAARVEDNFPAVISEVRPFMSRTAKAALGLPSYIIRRHEVPLDGIQAEVYELIANRFIKSLADAETWRDKLEALRRARPMRLMQAATNPDLLNLNDEYYQVRRVPDDSPTLMERLSGYRELEVPAKSLAAIDLIREIADAGGKVVCWSNFIANLDQFTRLVRDRIGIPTFQIDGRVPAGIDALHDQMITEDERPGETDTREAVIHRFLSQPDPAVLITNPASCSESISLHSSCHNAIYLDRTYDCALFLQSIDRIHRLGLPADTTVTVHLLMATLDDAATVDGLIDASLTRKEARMLELLEGAEIVPMSLANDPAEDAEGDDADLALLLRYLLGET